MNKPELIAELGRRIRKIEHPYIDEVMLRYSMVHPWKNTAPITLPRVLTALSHRAAHERPIYMSLDEDELSFYHPLDGYSAFEDYIGSWLLRINNRDATAEDQSEETLRALIDLFPEND